MKTIQDYLRVYSHELGEQLLENFPPLHGATNLPAPALKRLLRPPLPAQTVAIMGIFRRWQQANCAALIGEMGTGKTLMALAAIHAHHAHLNRCRYDALFVVPPQLVLKWCREALQTLRGVRVFIIDGLRDSSRNRSAPNGINEVVLRGGQVVRKGLHTTLTDLRQAKGFRSPKERWARRCPKPALFIVGRDRAKLSYFWKPIVQRDRHDGVINPDTGRALTAPDGSPLPITHLRRRRVHEIIDHQQGSVASPEDEPVLHAARTRYSALWEADNQKVRRYAPMDFIHRYLKGFFDYGVCDEVHEMKGHTAQGNVLGAMASSVGKTLILTGTLIGGYADDVYNVLFRLNPQKMLAEGFTWGAAGLRRFMERYGVLEKITAIEEVSNVSSRSRKSAAVRRLPGVAPLLFGKHLMGLAAFLNLEDISDSLPDYDEQVVPVEPDPELARAYGRLEADIAAALRASNMSRSVMSKGLNALLAYPDHCFSMRPLIGTRYDADEERMVPFTISKPANLSPDVLRPKEAKLIAEVKAELAEGRRCQVFCVYTDTYDVRSRLHRLLLAEGIRASVLTTQVRPELREAWYARELGRGTQVIVCHPRLVQTGLDLIGLPTILWYESGYSTFTLRQASRRSWRIGQHLPVRVKFFLYAHTRQERCLALMGRKLAVSLALEGKFSDSGLQGSTEDDILLAMAKELVLSQNVGESADSVWKKLRTQQLDHRLASAPPLPTPPPRSASETLNDETVTLPPLNHKDAVQLTLW